MPAISIDAWWLKWKSFMKQEVHIYDCIVIFKGLYPCWRACQTLHLRQAAAYQKITDRTRALCSHKVGAYTCSTTLNITALSRLLDWKCANSWQSYVYMIYIISWRHLKTVCNRCSTCMDPCRVQHRAIPPNRLWLFPSGIQLGGDQWQTGWVCQFLRCACVRRWSAVPCSHGSKPPIFSNGQYTTATLSLHVFVQITQYCQSQRCSTL